MEDCWWLWRWFVVIVVVVLVLKWLSYGVDQYRVLVVLISMFYGNQTCVFILIEI